MVYNHQFLEYLEPLIAANCPQCLYQDNGSSGKGNACIPCLGDRVGVVVYKLSTWMFTGREVLEVQVLVLLLTIGVTVFIVLVVITVLCFKADSETMLCAFPLCG